MQRLFSALAVLFGGLALATPSFAQRLDSLATPAADTVSVTLQQAVERALSVSEEVGLARAQVALAETQISQAYASAYPQVNGSLGYTRTLASAFDTGGGGFSLPDSLRFNPDPTAPLEERVGYLENNVGLAALGALGGLFSDLPFGQKNIYTYGLNGSQVLFSPQLGPAIQIAQRAREAAHAGLTETVADLRLQVEQAYVQALLAQELVGITEAAIAQAQAFLAQEQLRLRAGRASDLEVLRAEVDVENLRPQLVQAQDAAELAVLNLKRLANLPFEQPIVLTTPLTLPPPEALVVPELDPAAIVASRAALHAAEEQVEIRSLMVRMQKRAYLPTIALSTNYGRQLFPTGIFAFDTDWRTDWTVSLGVQVPIFDGFRRRAQVNEAQVNLTQAELQLAQLREGLRLQIEQALGEKRRASALIAARQRTVDQAARVYRLTQLQYEQGLSTQLEVSSARLALLSARSNLVQALATFYLADTDLVRATVTPGTLGQSFSIPEGDPLPRPELPQLQQQPQTPTQPPTPSNPTGGQ